MKKKSFVSFFLVIIFLAAGVFLINQPAKAPQKDQKENIENNNYAVNNINYVIKYVTIAGQKVKVDLALTSGEQSQGLSGRTQLKNDEGMLFVFDVPGKRSFWMKDMNFPIDIIWLSEDMKVIYIKKDTRPELYPESYGPEVDAKYVLEVVSGFSEKYNLKEGDLVEFVY